MLVISNRIPRTPQTPADLHWVYRLYDAADELLYIGCTCQLKTRLAWHRKREYGHRIARVASEVIWPRDTALNHEGALIEALQPSFNKRLTPRDRYTFHALPFETTLPKLHLAKYQRYSLPIPPARDQRIRELLALTDGDAPPPVRHERTI